MNTRLKLALILASAAMLAAAGLGAASTKPPAAATAPATPIAKIDSLAFLAGTWSGEMEGDDVEETWSVPKGDSIIGMFRWLHGDKGETTMWELLSIKREDSGPVLRLRHFDKAFAPWKNETGAVTPMKATTIEKARVVFSNDSAEGGPAACEYQCPTPDRLLITVSFKDAAREALKFDLKRAGGN